MTKQTHPPRIGQHWPEHDGIYAGTTVSASGESEHHIVVIALPVQDIHFKMKFNEALGWVKHQQGSVPTCREMAIINANVPGIFERKFYWSCEPCSAGEDWAWGREFLAGAQVNAPMTDLGLVRAIRRIPVAYSLPLRDPDRALTEQGLFQKFEVTRLDGQDAPGCKHHNCRLFVLDLDHDPFAVPALQAYAGACWTAYPELSNDIAAQVDTVSLMPLVSPSAGIELNGHQLKAALAMVDNDVLDDPLDGAVTIRWWPALDGMPAGLYAFDSEYPEEGHSYLDPSPALDPEDTRVPTWSMPPTGEPDASQFSEEVLRKAHQATGMSTPFEMAIRHKQTKSAIIDQAKHILHRINPR